MINALVDIKNEADVVEVVNNTGDIYFIIKEEEGDDVNSEGEANEEDQKLKSDSFEIKQEVRKSSGDESSTEHKTPRRSSRRKAKPETSKPAITFTSSRTHRNIGDADTTNKFACDQCDLVFNKNVRLLEHKRLHTGEKPFTCDECSKQFRTNQLLYQHKRRHSKQKKFICDVCQLGCCTKQDLNQHMRHHTNDRRFQCSMCAKAFVRNSDLKTHVRLHTGEKPYVCDICQKCFAANQNLIIHKKSHMGEASKTFKCEHCDKKFMRNIDRKVHLRSHTKEKPYKCERCNLSYTTKLNLKGHIDRGHTNKKRGRKAKSTNRKKEAKNWRDEVGQQNKLIEELQNQLKRQNKTEEKVTPFPAVCVGMQLKEESPSNASFTGQPQVTVKMENVSAPETKSKDISSIQKEREDTRC